MQSNHVRCVIELFSYSQTLKFVACIMLIQVKIYSCSREHEINKHSKLKITINISVKNTNQRGTGYYKTVAAEFSLSLLQNMVWLFWFAGSS